MKKYLYVLFLLLLANSGYCQNDYDPQYYDSLYNELLKDSSIIEIKQHDEKYKNGNLKIVYTLVKFENDSIDRYWFVGRSQSFRRNGSIFKTLILDLDGKMKEAYEYWPNGNLYREKIYNIEDDCQIVDFEMGSACYPMRLNGKKYIFNRIVEDVNLKYDINSEKLEYHGIIKKYQSTLSRNKIRVIEMEYNMGKRISVNKYKIPKSSIK